jgi:catechol 2,3-dioxygenase-like lactoylglutathione lyase family enzyme
MAEDRFDRTTQDVGNIVALEHVNVRVPDQQLATVFYVVGLGLTRDPYLMTGLENMWVNIGQQQFHLPTGAPQVLRGDVGLVIPDFDELPGRLAMVKGRLEGTHFAYSVEDKHVRVVSPWGNVLRCHPPGPSFGDMTLGMPYVEFAVEPGTADGIARFYREGFGAAAVISRNAGGTAARVTVGPHQELVFHETTDAIPAYDGHHIQIYITSFSGPHRWLAERGLVTEESNWYQYRFEDIVDPDTGRVLFTIEHEVRSLRSPLYLRPLVNRNVAQRQPTYQRGRDAFVPGMS